MVTLHQKPDLGEVLENLGVELRGSRGSCPLCQADHKGFSLSIDIDRGLWKCFRCNHGGDSIRLIALSQGRSDRDVISDYNPTYKPKQQRLETALERDFIREILKNSTAENVHALADIPIDKFKGKFTRGLRSGLVPFLNMYQNLKEPFNGNLLEELIIGCMAAGDGRDWNEFEEKKFLSWAERLAR